MNNNNKIYKAFNHYAFVIKDEFYFMLHDSGVMLLMLGAIFIYSTLYSLAYRNQVVRNLPVAVVDLNNTPTSRQFIRNFDESPNVTVEYTPTNLEEAKKLFYDRKVYGILLIPVHFEKEILGGEQTVVSIYADASYFLMYKQMFAAATSTIGYENIVLETGRFMANNMSEKDVKALSEPVLTETVKLYNRTEGYATFVMPAIMILILQQTILIGVGLIGGTFREKRLYERLVDKDGNRFSTSSVVLGKTTAYFSFIAIVAFVVFGAFYKLFGYPTRGKEIEVFMFFIPYILSSSFLALAISTLFKYRETAILVLVVWSIPFLLFSGVSFPQQGMPEWFFDFGKIIPSSSAINGFIRLQVMGASLKDISPLYLTLWGLSGIYCILAMVAMHFRLKTEFKRSKITE